MGNGKRVMAISLGAAVLTAGAFLPLAASSQDQASGNRDGYGYCGGPGWMGGSGHRGSDMMGDYGDRMGRGAFGGPGFGLISRLDLTDSQRAQISEIRSDLRRKHWAAMGKIADARAKIRDLYAASEPDPKAVGTAYADIGKLHQEMIEGRVQALDQARAVLTKEQRQQLDTWRRGASSMAGRGPALGRRPSRVD